MKTKITDIKHSKAAIVSTLSEQKLLVMVENARSINMLMDSAGLLQYVSPACRNVLAWSQEELVGRSSLEVTFDEDRAVFESALESLRSKPGSFLALPLRWLHKDGSVRNFDCTLKNLLDDASIGAIVCNAIDVTALTLQQQDLDRARSTLKAVLDSSKDGISAVDTERHLIAYNAFMKDILWQMFGIEVREGVKLGELMTPEEATFWYDVETRALRGEHVTQERTYSTPYGEVIIEYSLYPIYDGEVITGASVFGKNVTIQRQTEKEYRILFDESPLPMWVIDIETLRFLRVNRAACDLYGYSVDEFLQMTPRDIRILEDQEIFDEVALPQIKDLHDEVPIIVRHKKKNGDLIEVRLMNHVIQFGSKVARMTLVEDITQRLRAEREVIEVNERYQLASEAITSVIYDLDIASGRSIRSQGLKALLGFDSLQDTIETIDWWFSRVHPDDLEKMGNITSHFILADKIYEAEYRMLHKDGHYVYVWDRGIIVRDNKGTPVRVIGSTQDISARKQMEAQLLQERNNALLAKESAEEMSRLKTNFLANMSHEIRTPMTAILGFAAILAEELADTTHGRQASIIESNAKRLLETINSILDLARVESKRIKLSFSKININSEIERLVGLLEPLASQKHLELRFSPSREPAETFIDAHYLSQIVTNLIGNALKFTEDGCVRVFLQMGKEINREIPLISGFTSFSTAPHPKEEYFRILVEDTGLGISKENMGLIFDEFKQESTGYHRSYEGSGLGLTISSKLASAMGGSIEVRSARGVGSTFIVRLPRKLEQPAPESEEFSQPKSKKTLPTILLVEDSTETAEMIGLMLAPLSEFYHAANAAAAEKLLEELRPKLILMDINLGPGRTGLDLAAKLRKDTRMASIPIVALTAFAMPDDRRASLNAGCQDYLIKPFTKEELLEVVERNLRKESNAPLHFLRAQLLDKREF